MPLLSFFEKKKKKSRVALCCLRIQEYVLIDILLVWFHPAHTPHWRRRLHTHTHTHTHTSFPSWSTTCGFRGVIWLQFSLLRWLGGNKQKNKKTKNSGWPAWFSLDKSAFQRTLALFGQSLLSTGSRRSGGLYIFWIRCCTALASLSNGNLCQGWRVCMCVCVCVCSHTVNQLHLSSGGHVFAAHCCCCSDVSGGKGHTTSTCVNYAAIAQHVFLGTAVSLLVMSRERCIDVSLTSGVTSKGMLQFREKKFKPIHFDICDINDGVIFFP